MGLTEVAPHVSLLLAQSASCPEGTKPLLVFAGDAFDTNGEYSRLRSILIGEFRLAGQPLKFGSILSLNKLL